MKGMQVKLGGATNSYICYPTPMAIKEITTPFRSPQLHARSCAFVFKCLIKNVCFRMGKISRDNSFSLSSQHHCTQEKQQFLSYSWPNSGCKIEETFKRQINRNCMFEKLKGIEGKELLEVHFCQGGLIPVQCKYIQLNEYHAV